MGTILAIDPGNMESGYVLVEHDGQEIRKVLDVGKIPNDDMYNVLCSPYDHLAIEMVAGMGMPVGQEVFDTCFWIGRFWEFAFEPPGCYATRRRKYTGEKKSFTCAATRRRRTRTSGKPSSTATRPDSRTTAREQRRIPVSFTGSQRTCGRRWR